MKQENIPSDPIYKLKVEIWGSQVRMLWLKHGPSHSPRCPPPEEPDDVLDPDGVWMERAASNICRARSRVKELAACNPWEYFCTFTLNAEKQDRFDLRGFKRDLGVWVGNYNKKFGTKLRYLIVPEPHKDGAVHAHGLLSGVAPSSLVENAHGYLDMPYYQRRFGFINLDPIRDPRKVSTYIVKYIGKDFGADGFAGSGEHLFLSSRGLAGKKVVYECWSRYHPGEAYENDHCCIKWVDDLGAAAPFIRFERGC